MEFLTKKCLDLESFHDLKKWIFQNDLTKCLDRKFFDFLEFSLRWAILTVVYLSCLYVDKNIFVFDITMQDTNW